jgi:NADPH:quinone reductase-like Zn-dependent oxidoreductase
MRAMRAIGIHETTGPNAAMLLDLPDPQPGPNEVRVRLAASALNHLDLWAASGIPGITPVFPFVLGADGAGTIDAIGRGVDPGRLGEDVVINGVLSCGRCARCASGARMLCREFGMLGEHRNGTHADLVIVPDAGAVPRPALLSPEEAAAGGVVYATAYRMLFTKARAEAGEVVLIHGIGGGLALAALQLALVRGLTCVVTSSDDHKLARARALGAHHAINYRTDDVVARVRKAVGGVDIVIDPIGASVWETSLRLLNADGRLVNCGAGGGRTAEVPIAHLFWRQLEILGSTMATDAEFSAALRLVVRENLRPVIDHAVQLEDVPDALRALERGTQFGKVVVTR